MARIPKLKLSRNKRRATVRDPERVAYPGIYQDPRDIVDQVQVSPESENLKKLFNVSRGELAEMADQPGTLANPVLPGAVENARGSAAAERVMTKRNQQRLLDILSETQQRRPELWEGMKGWYQMDPAYDRLGALSLTPDEDFTRLNTLTGMASPGSDVVTELNRGTAANLLARQGEFETFLKGGGQAGRIPGMEHVRGHAYHKTAQGLPMQRFLETGEMQMASPKVPMYIQASNARALGNQTRIPVGDAHWSRGVGLADVRTNKNFGASVSTPEMQALAPWWEQNIAGELGLESVPAQAIQWGVLGPQTGVKTAVGAPKLEILSDEIAAAAKREGIKPEQMRDRVLLGLDYTGGPIGSRGGALATTLGAGGIGALAMAPEDAEAGVVRNSTEMLRGRVKNDPLYMRDSKAIIGNANTIEKRMDVQNALAQGGVNSTDRLRGRPAGTALAAPLAAGAGVLAASPEEAEAGILNRIRRMPDEDLDAEYEFFKSEGRLDEPEGLMLQDERNVRADYREFGDYDSRRDNWKKMDPEGYDPELHAFLESHGYVDNSWHNNGAPSFYNPRNNRMLWINYADKANREVGADEPRFVLDEYTDSDLVDMKYDPDISIQTDDPMELASRLRSVGPATVGTGLALAGAPEPSFADEAEGFAKAAGSIGNAALTGIGAEAQALMATVAPWLSEDEALRIAAEARAVEPSITTDPLAEKWLERADDALGMFFQAFDTFGEDVARGFGRQSPVYQNVPGYAPAYEGVVDFYQGLPERAKVGIEAARNLFSPI